LALVSRLGVVIPTLGTRLDFLEKCLKSVREVPGTWIVIVCPQQAAGEISRKFGPIVNQITTQINHGLASAINEGVSSIPEDVDVITWLGDDDLLVSKGVIQSLAIIQSDTSIAATFGICNYINEFGIPFWQNKFGQQAVSKLLFGPDRIPQPGSLLRRIYFEKVHMLNSKLAYAFDLDLFIKLSKVGRVQFVPELVSMYRWHPSSLSSSGRTQSDLEAHKVRQTHLPPALKLVSWFWETPIILAGRLLPNRFDRMAKEAIDEP